MKRVIAIVVTSVLSLTGLSFAMAPSASAHHPIVTGVGVCNTDTGDFDITWEVANSESHKMVFTSRLGDGEVASNQSDPAVLTESVEDAGTYSLKVDAVWPRNHFKNTATGYVTVEGDCDVPVVPPKVKKTFVNTRVRDWCNCFHDFAKMKHTGHVSVVKTHPTNTKWVFKVIADKNYLVSAVLGGGAPYVHSAKFVVKTTNKKCHGHPNGPVAPPSACRGADCD